MAHISLLFLFLTLLSLSSSIRIAQAAHNRPKALLLPIRKDATTNLLVADIYGRTPLVPVGFIVDLTARHLWANCETNYKSSTFSEPKCGSTQCKTANTSFCHTCPRAARRFCHANTCGLLLENPVSHQSTIGEVAQDVIAFRSTNGSNPGPLVKIKDFLFTCSPSALVEIGLPKGVQGVAGLAQAPIALQNQLASRLGLKPIFTMCVPYTALNGVIFFGSNGPYSIPPYPDVSNTLKYTPMSISPFGEYYVKLKSIKVSDKQVKLNTSLLSISHELGTGGTTLNTLLPYTVLEGSIYKAVTLSFARELATYSSAQRVKAVAPFELCYDSAGFTYSRVGPDVPGLSLELEGGVEWPIYSPNSMVMAKPNVLCLAFVNGGNEYRASVNIGTFQMQNFLLQFDLPRSRLGVGELLLNLRTRCDNFNFTVVA